MATDDADHAMDSDETMTAMVQRQQLSIGFGCSSRASSDDILRLIRTVLDPVPAGTGIATLDRRASIGEVVAEELKLRLVLFPSAVLAGIEAVTTRSVRALAETQTANVAEAAALASLGPTAHLLVRQTKGHFCTCAVAAVDIAVQP